MNTKLDCNTECNSRFSNDHRHTQFLSNNFYKSLKKNEKNIINIIQYVLKVIYE